MLFQYREQVQRLLSDTGQMRANIGDLDVYINQARGQLAGESECIRVFATLPVAPPVQQYPFGSIALGAAVGVQGVLNIRMASYAVASGRKRITSREWEWFNTFILSRPVPHAAPPSIYAQYGQGANGTIFVNTLDRAYTLSLDTVCYPAALTSDQTPEAVPYLWTDAVPYYAAYLSLLSFTDRVDQAENMLKRYELFTGRARRIATPSVLPHQYSQASDLMVANRLGITPAKGA